MDANAILISVIGLFLLVTGLMYLSHIKKKDITSKREKSVSYGLFIAGLIIFALPFLSSDTDEENQNRPIKKSVLLGEDAYRQDVQVDSKNYKKASELYAKGAGLWLIEGSLYDSTSRAMTYFDQSIQLYETAEALVGRGQLKVQLSDMQGAMADYERAIEVNPNFGNAFFNRAALYYIFGDKQKACDDWRKAMDLGQPQAAEVLGNICV